ncbi:hypothetical protein [Clostridiisalibacter paucivorans]|uniref:hypothetical protein n=1 Tax=Clostridiisalibacter paucivorans TaxID=408753 RepID=UPI00047B015A|nr:hypothetical protein [Clostridiisalibacter paucivorans]
MSYMTIRQIKHEICLNKLRDLGCEVISIQGVMFYVKCPLSELDISYVYHLNPDNTFDLERIKPYFISVGNLTTEKEVVDLISIDIKQFKNAKKSQNFNMFVDADRELANMVKAFEDLFLYYNIDKEDISLIKGEIRGLKELLLKVKSKSKRIFYDKDPDNI